MLLAWIMPTLACLPLANPDTPGSVPVYRVPGPAFDIPCKVTEKTPDLAAVQLWVSGDGGRTWERHSEMTPEGTRFEFHAKQPGEYAFAARLKFKDGSTLPAAGQLEATQRVVVEAGDGPAAPERSARLAKTVGDLDDELTRLEFDLIRKEIKRLAEEKGLNQETANQIDRLRSRLREAQNRLPPAGPRTNDDGVLPGVRGYHPSLIPPPVPPVPVAPAPRAGR